MEVNRLLAGTLALVLAAGFGMPAYGGVCVTSDDLANLISNPANCISVDDKTFTNFRNFFGNFDPAQIQVTGVTVGDEKGLQFTSQVLSVNGPGQGLGIGFDYDVISSGDPISDNTLTIDASSLQTAFPGTSNTGAVVEERVHSDVAQQNQIAFKAVFFDAAGNSDKEDHVDYGGSFPFVSVNVDIGLTTEQNCSICGVTISQFTQTFSQEPEEPEPPVVGGELIPIQTTSLLLANAQSFSWMIPVVLSGIGIGLFVFRKSENS